MNVSVKQSKFLAKILCFVTVAVLFVSAFSATAFAGSEGVTDPEGNASDYSFYQLASTAAGCLSSACSDANDAPTAVYNKFNTLTPDSAGGVLAYTDRDNTKGIWGMFMAQLSLGSNTKDYKSLSKGMLACVSGTGHTSTGVFTPYITLGATLADMGLDQTGSAVETATMFSKRAMIGAITMAAYIFAQSVCVIFKIVIDFLRFLNPFALFAKISSITQRTSWENAIRQAGGSSLVSAPLRNSNLAVLVSTFYDKLFIAGYVLIVILFVIMMFQFLRPGARNRGTLLKNWFIRALFIFGGIAILGGTYTNLLDQLSGEVSAGNNAATKVVASTFCDFEGWVLEGMPKPDTVTIKAKIKPGGNVQASSENCQEICYQINSKAGASLPASSLTSSSTSALMNSLTNYNTSTHNSGDQVAIFSEETAATALTHVEDNTVWALGVLSRYSMGTKIYSSSYETLWKSTWWSTKENIQCVAKRFKEIATIEGFGTVLEEGRMSFSYGMNWQATSDAGATVSARSPFSGGSGNPSDAVSNGPAASNCYTNLSGGSYSGYSITVTNYWNGGLSAMSIYNYLNSTFSNTYLVVYSSSNSASNYVRDSHYSVNLVGKGVDSLVYLGICLTLLISYGVLGFYYGLGILIVNLKRGIRLIVAVPGAMLGSLQSIAKVISYTVLMICEIVLNIFLYALTTDLLYTIGCDFAGKVTTATTNVFGVGGELVTPITGILVIIFLIWFTKECMALRKPLIKSLEEMADNVVQKFITGTSAAEQRAMMARQGGAGAAGAGAGAGAAGADGKNGKNKNGKEIGLGGQIAASAVTPGGLGGMMVAGHNAKVRAKNKRDAKQAEREAKGALLLSQMGLAGGTSSAVDEEKNLNNYQAAMRDAKKQTRREKAEAAKKMVAGTVQTAGAVAGAVATHGASASGSAKLGARGLKNISEGAKDLANADINDAARKADIAAATAQANGSSLSKHADKATGDTYANYGSNVKKFNAAEEAKATASAVVDMAGGAAGGAAAGSSATLGGGAGAANMGQVAGGADMAQIAGGSQNATAMLSQTQSVDTVTQLTAGSNTIEGGAMAGKTLQGMPSNLVGSESATANGTMAVNTNTQLTEGANNISGSVNGGGKGFNVGGGSQQSAQVSDSMNVSRNTSFNETMGNVQNMANKGQQMYNQAVSGTSSYGSVTDDYTEVHQSNINTIRSGGSVVGSGNSGGAFGMAGGTSQTMNVQDNMTVNRQQNVNTNYGGGSVGGGRGMQQAHGSNQTVNVQDNTTVNRQQNVRTNYTGGGSVGGARGVNAKGSNSNMNVQDNTNVNRHQNVNTNYSGGGSAGGARGGVSAKGNNQTINVKDNVTVNRQQNVKTNAPSAPRNINPDNND